MSRSLRAGLIGCGNLGRVHTEALQTLDGMEMVAFCDIDRAKAASFCARYGGVRATDDPDELFNDPSLDAIYVCTWHDTHADLCIRAAEAGKHILVEKPLALTVEACRAVGQAVARSGVKLMTAFKMRYYDMVRQARTLIPHPLLVTMQMMDDPWGADHWASDPILGGGNVLSQGCHSCDLLRFVAGGDPIEVYAVGGNYYTASGVIDNLVAAFRFEPVGGTGSVAGSWVQGDANCPPLASKFFLQIYGEGRSATLSDRLCTLTYSEQGREPQVFRGTESGFVEENRAFVDCLLAGTPPAIDHVDGLMATLMVLQAFKSIESGQPEPVASLARSALA
jgi:predicted dehydrogenase